MALGLYDWLYGVAQFAAAFLSVIAILISVSLFETAWKNHKFLAWRYLLMSIVLFACEEIIGALITFGIIGQTFLTHVIPSFIMVFCITALIAQIYDDKLLVASKRTTGARR